MTCSPYTQAEIDAKVLALKALIAAYEAAILSFAVNGAQQSYSLDTGQTRQTVMRAQLPSLRDTLSSLENQLATFTARYCGGSIYARPAF